MDTKLLHIRDKLEFIIRFMMAGDGSFKARLSEAYRHPQYGLRQVPMLFMPAELKDDFENLLRNIDRNEKSKVLNETKMGLMDEVFFFYKKICDLIFAQTLDITMKKVFAPPKMIEQSDVSTTGLVSELFPTKTPRPKKIKKPKKEKN
jgi:hypothetical protein